MVGISDELCQEVALGPGLDIAVSAEGIWNISF